MKFGSGVVVVPSRKRFMRVFVGEPGEGGGKGGGEGEGGEGGRGSQLV